MIYKGTNNQTSKISKLFFLPHSHSSLNDIMESKILLCFYCYKMKLFENQFGLALTLSTLINLLCSQKLDKKIKDQAQIKY